MSVVKVKVKERKGKGREEWEGSWNREDGKTRTVTGLRSKRVTEKITQNCSSGRQKKTGDCRGLSVAKAGKGVGKGGKERATRSTKANWKEKAVSDE